MLVCWLIVCVCVCLGSCYICKWQSIWPSGSERTYNLPRPGQQCIHLPRRGTGSHCGWNTSHNWRNVPESFTGLYSTVQYSTVQCVSLDTHCLVGTRWMRIISQVCTVQYSTVQCVSLDTHCLVGTRWMRIISQDNWNCSFNAIQRLLAFEGDGLICTLWSRCVETRQRQNSATSAFRLSDLHIY